jgi:hypothetical protein
VVGGGAVGHLNAMMRPAKLTVIPGDQRMTHATMTFGERPFQGSSTASILERANGADYWMSALRRARPEC